MSAPRGRAAGRLGRVLRLAIERATARPWTRASPPELETLPTSARRPGPRRREAMREQALWQCNSCGLRVSRVNLTANLALALLKGLVGVMAGSRALVAGVLYSVNDVLSAAIVIVSLRAARRPADANHQYGHGKIEFLAVGLVSLLLAVGVFLILRFSLTGIMSGEVHRPHPVALVVAALAGGANWMLAQQGFCSAKQLGSPALLSSAEHNHADAVSSAAVLVGVGFAMMGLGVVDRLVAVFEALHILWLGGTLFGKALKGLMDTALPPAEVARLRRACRRVDGVLGVLDLRTRLAGSEVLADVVVGVSATLTVDEAHGITERVREELLISLPRDIRASVGFRPIDAVGERRPGARLAQSER
jgi:cation diffusion facilitator family transporter